MQGFEVSATEPPEVRALGTTTSTPESVGSDVLWQSPIGLVGVQRKTLTDLVVSLRSGRLGQEATRMRLLAVRVLLLEGRLRWSPSGRLSTVATPITREMLRGICLSAQQRGMWVVHTDDVADTVAAIHHLRHWLERRHHSSLEAGPLRERAGPHPAVGSRDWGVQLLRCFPLVGPVVAGSLWDHFGAVPLAWTADASALAAVAGVGPKRAAALVAALLPATAAGRTAAA